MKRRPQSETDYQIRINGSPIAHYAVFGDEILEDFVKVAKDNPDDYVDIAAIRTEILMSQFSYNQMMRHFSK